MQQKQRLNVEISPAGKKKLSLSTYGGVLRADAIV
jgi:hypothetical protein